MLQCRSTTSTASRETEKMKAFHLIWHPHKVRKLLQAACIQGAACQAYPGEEALLVCIKQDPEGGRLGLARRLHELPSGAGLLELVEAACRVTRTGCACTRLDLNPVGTCKT